MKYVFKNHANLLIMLIMAQTAFIFSCSSDSSDDGKLEHYGIKKEQFYDERDGKKYVYVTIGTQVWMAENLNYETEGSRCYGDETGDDSLNNCATYGRLYKWSEALEICPEGWHLPSSEDWDILKKYIIDENKDSPLYNPKVSIDGKYLKTKTGWATQAMLQDVDGEDKYGFAALPGGYAGYNILGILGGKGSFKEITKRGYWWSSTENRNDAYCIAMFHTSYSASLTICGYNNGMISVRCIQD
jgi:uncharacterized protein (TIGR02145 family)